MIYSIRGTLRHLKEGYAVIEDKAGVLWEAEISRRTLQSLQKACAWEQHSSFGGASCELFTILYHKQDSMNLYGFADTIEKDLFLKLNKVNGVGPKQSLRILSSTDGDSLKAAIVQENESFLTALPGIGSKGAKRIILTLKDEFKDFAGTEYSSPAGQPSSNGWDQVVEALVQMGFDRPQAKKAVETVVDAGNHLEGQEGEVLRKAIIALS